MIKLLQTSLGIVNFNCFCIFYNCVDNLFAINQPSCYGSMVQVSSLYRADFGVLEWVTLSKVINRTSEFEVSKQCENFLTHYQSPITTHLVLQEKYNG